MYRNFAALDIDAPQLDAKVTAVPGIDTGDVQEANDNAPRTITGFSPIEWQVVALARQDRLSTLREPSRLLMALGAISVGQRPNPRLADPRLEALRRIAVFAWHRGYALPASEIESFHQAGFTIDQLETLLASIGKGRAALNQGRRS